MPAVAQEAREDAYDVLMDLLDAGKTREVVWTASDPFVSFADYAEMDETEAAYREMFDNVVLDLTSSIGRPRYVGDKQRPDFPSWSGALHLAVWEIQGKGAYVAVEHRQQDDPFELRIGVR
jgi:hypothetical protein